MASQLFAPKGEKAAWVPLYEGLRGRDYGDVVTYEMLDEMLDGDIREDRAPLYRAMRELERSDHRTLVVVTSVGYRIANPDEHRGQAEKHRKKSYRQVVKARRKISSAPRDLLPEDELRWLDETDIRLSQLEMGLRHTNKRVARLERSDEVKQSALSEINEALAKLREKGLLD